MVEVRKEALKLEYHFKPVVRVSSSRTLVSWISRPIFFLTLC